MKANDTTAAGELLATLLREAWESYSAEEDEYRTSFQQMADYLMNKGVTIPATAPEGGEAVTETYERIVWAAAQLLNHACDPKGDGDDIGATDDLHTALRRLTNAQYAWGHLAALASPPAAGPRNVVVREDLCRALWDRLQTFMDFPKCSWDAAEACWRDSVRSAVTASVERVGLTQDAPAAAGADDWKARAEKAENELAVFRQASGIISKSQARRILESEPADAKGAEEVLRKAVTDIHEAAQATRIVESSTYGDFEFAIERIGELTDRAIKAIAAMERPC